MTRPLLEVFGIAELQQAFIAAHASQEQTRQHRQRERAAQQQARQEMEARRIRPMSTNLEGLGKQIDAALAASRHVQELAVGTRRREQDVAALRAEASESRRGGGGRRVG